MPNYFKKCKSKEDAEKRYRELAKKLHPDVGGTDEDFKNLNFQYKEFLKNLEMPAEEIEVQEKPRRKIKIEIPKERQDEMIKSAGDFFRSAGETFVEIMLKKIGS